MCSWSSTHRTPVLAPAGSGTLISRCPSMWSSLIPTSGQLQVPIRDAPHNTHWSLPFKSAWGEFEAAPVPEAVLSARLGHSSGERLARLAACCAATAARAWRRRWTGGSRPGRCSPPCQAPCRERRRRLQPAHRGSGGAHPCEPRVSIRRRGRFEEHAVDRRRQVAAESLARAASVDYAVAYRHLANGTARFLIEVTPTCPRRRSYSPEGSPRWRLCTSCRRSGPYP